MRIDLLSNLAKWLEAGKNRGGGSPAVKAGSRHQGDKTLRYNRKLLPIPKLVECHSDVSILLDASLGPFEERN